MQTGDNADRERLHERLVSGRMFICPLAPITQFISKPPIKGALLEGASLTGALAIFDVCKSYVRANTAELMLVQTWPPKDG